MNYINLKDEKLVVSFRFDPSIVAAVRGIDGRIWNAKEKQWEIPKENVVDALAILEPLGFIPHQAVLALKRDQVRIRQEIEDIKLSGDSYRGTLLPSLYEFQKIGASFIKQMPSCLLGDVPGLGKSIQTIAGTEEDEQILIFCPSTLKYNWSDEILKWFPQAKILVVNGNKQERSEQWAMAVDGAYYPAGKLKPKYVIANYELLIHDFDLFKDAAWPVIACDEATRISNSEAKTTQNLKKLKAKKRIALTGTPISNSPDDIFSLIDWIAPGYLGSFYQFRDKYCVLGDYDRVISYKNLDVLAEKIGRFMLRRTKEEVFTDFPPKTVEYVRFDLPVSEQRFYTSIKESVIKEIKELGALDTRTLGIVPVKMLRLKQCTDHTKLVEGYGRGESTKLETLRELIAPILASGEKVIIFTQFARMLFIMMEELAKYKPFGIYGDVDSPERMIRVKEFNDTPGAAVIIMTEAGAYGLNMQSASYVVHYDAPWSIAKLQQREDRAHRIGQNKPVTVYHLVAKNTIDEYILKVLERKGKVSGNILKDAERIDALTREDIEEILERG